MIKTFLGMHFEEVQGKCIFISQEAYITYVVKKLLHVNEKYPSRVPALVKETGPALDDEEIINVPYRNAVGALIYISSFTGL